MAGEKTPETGQHYGKAGATLKRHRKPDVAVKPEMEKTSTVVDARPGGKETYEQQQLGQVHGRESAS